MVLLAIVASKDVEFLIEQRCRVILYLRRLDALVITVTSLAIGIIIIWIRQVLQESSETAISSRNLILVFVAFSDEDPFQPLRRLLSWRRDGQIVVRRVVAMNFVGLRLVFLLLFSDIR